MTSTRKKARINYAEWSSEEDEEFEVHEPPQPARASNRRRKTILHGLPSLPVDLLHEVSLTLMTFFRRSSTFEPSRLDILTSRSTGLAASSQIDQGVPVISTHQKCHWHLEERSTTH